MQTIQDMDSGIRLKVQHRELRFCGKNLRQADDFTIKVDQFDAIENVDYDAPLQRMPGHDQRYPECQCDQRFQGIDWPDRMGHKTNQARPHG